MQEGIAVFLKCCFYVLLFLCNISGDNKQDKSRVRSLLEVAYFGKLDVHSTTGEKPALRQRDLELLDEKSQ